MAAPSETYVDPSIAANSGTGTIGDPYGDLQYALDTMTRDSTNGDRINIKSGTAEVLTGSLDFSTYGTPNRTSPLLLEGYDSTAGDGGIGGIDGNAGNFSIISSNPSFMGLKRLKLFNTGTAVVLSINRHMRVDECEITESSTGGVLGANDLTQVIRCYIHNIAGYGVQLMNDVTYCYFANGSTNKFTSAVVGSSTSVQAKVINCFFNLDNTSNAINVQFNIYNQNNSILSNAGTGYGIRSYRIPQHIVNNLIEGFSGTGGVGISVSESDTFAHDNAIYDCATDISLAANCDVLPGQTNESLSASPFAKTGSLPTDFTSATFWSDLYAYFAPVDTGNVYSGYPTGSNQTKGAVGQPVGGGAGGGLLRVNMNGNVFG
jgi:hypothetical protein